MPIQTCAVVPPYSESIVGGWHVRNTTELPLPIMVGSDVPSVIELIATGPLNQPVIRGIESRIHVIMSSPETDSRLIDAARRMQQLPILLSWGYADRS